MKRSEILGLALKDVTHAIDLLEASIRSPDDPSYVICRTTVASDAVVRALALLKLSKERE